MLLGPALGLTVRLMEPGNMFALHLMAVFFGLILMLRSWRSSDDEHARYASRLCHRALAVPITADDTPGASSETIAPLPVRVGFCVGRRLGLNKDGSPRRWMTGTGGVPKKNNAGGMKAVMVEDTCGTAASASCGSRLPESIMCLGTSWVLVRSASSPIYARSCMRHLLID